jgi:hypothetical protein
MDNNSGITHFAADAGNFLNTLADPILTSYLILKTAKCAENARPVNLGNGDSDKVNGSVYRYL